MAIITAIAIYFIIWWLTLFAMLPFGLKTQRDAGDVTLGTVESAPSGRHMGRTFLRTTLVASLLFAGFWYVTQVLGYGIADMPQIVPGFQ
jgi:predicted secreted protein